MEARTYVVCTLVVGLVLSSGARADDAAELKKQGDDAMHALHYSDALQLYARAYADGHDPAILYNEARAHQALGDWPAALDALQQFVRVAPDALKMRVPKLADLMTDLQDHVGLVVVTSSVPGAAVLVQGKVVGKTPLHEPIKVSKGPVTVTVEAAGYQPFHADVVAAGGGKLTTVDAPLVPEQVGPAVQPPPDGRHIAAGWPVAAWTTGAVGLAGLVVGATFGGLVAMKNGDASPHCPNKACDPVGWADVSDAKAFATVSTVGFIAGGVLVAAAVGIFLIAPRTKASTAWAPVLGPGFVGLRGVF